MDNFKLGKLLGKGAFGSVSLVTRKTDGKIYAMKRVNIGKLNNKEKESSLNEIRILASLSHPNIIGYKEAFFDQSTNTLNIVMEFADEGDLEKKIKNNLKKRLNFDENTIWNWIIQLLKGIKYLHDNRIMHRDLKCANIFLMKNGLLKLGDLNVSKFAKLGMANTQTGTPYYCSPEIWKEKSYDYKSDIWSLGCIIYEICSLRPPFRGTSLNGLKNNVLNGHYLPIPANYSYELSELISKMLVIDPYKRASAAELLKDDIVVNKMKNINNIFGNDIKGYNFEKANLIKTIKLPLNIKEINSKLPKKRYNPEEEMMKNDEYETMKQTFFQNLNKENKNKENNNQKKIIKHDVKNENNYQKIKEKGNQKHQYKKQLINNKKNNIYEKNNNEIIKSNKKIENDKKNSNIRNNNQIDNNIDKNYLHKSEENKKNEDYIFNNNLNYQYEQALKNNYKLKKFYSKQIQKKNSEEKKNVNNNKYNEYLEKFMQKNNNYINNDNDNNKYKDYNQNKNKKINNVLIDNINNNNYIKIFNQNFPSTPYNLVLNNNQNNIILDNKKKNRFKYLFNDDNDNDNDNDNSNNIKNSDNRNSQEMKKPINPPRSAIQRKNNINLQMKENKKENNNKNNKKQQRPITALPSNININKQKKNIKKKNSSKINNLYDKYKNKNKNEKNNNIKFKYVPKKRQVYKIDINKINYNDYCKKNNIDKNKKYHYYRENGYYNYRNEMKKYGDFVKNKNAVNKQNSNEIKNRFNNYLKNEYKGGGGAGYAARIRMQKYNK